MDRINDLLNINRKKKNNDREPQSEREEAKGVNKFETEIVD